jgi:hypothetical protein
MEEIGHAAASKPLVHGTAGELHEAGVDLGTALPVQPTEGSGTANQWILPDGELPKWEAYRATHPDKG